MANVNPAKTADFNARLFLLQQKKFLENDIAFFKDYEAFLQRWESGTVKRVMKFVSVLSTGKQKINLVDFYKLENHEQSLNIWPDFWFLLREATEEDRTPEVEIDETFYQYKNMESSTGDGVRTELSEGFIDLRDSQGRLEARKRLGAAAFFLKKQPGGEKGELIANGSFNIAGWFVFSRGSVMMGCSFSWNSTTKSWDCDARLLGQLPAGRRWWSRNHIAQ